MFRHAGPIVHDALVRCLNKVLHTGEYPNDWGELLYVMIPKTGNTMDVNNWRPLAILDITYKIFSRILHRRLMPILEPHQPPEQMGFRPSLGTDYALLVLENVIQKSIEYNMPLWIISVDLSKAFDRIDHASLFAALEEQGVPCAYQTLLKRVYHCQHGVVDGCAFSIDRGVRQGDVLSPMLFNAALESAMKRWKERLHNRGLLLQLGCERLTNLRYADDLVIFGRTIGEAVFMYEALVEELSRAGLSINGGKTKVLTTVEEIFEDRAPLLVEAAGSLLEVVKCNGSHKYLGRMFSGDLRKRGQCNLEHRLSCAWMKFHHLAATLVNRNIPVRLRLRLFDTVVTPVALYSLSTTPLTATQLEKHDVTQRKMLRKIVGWVRSTDETWAETGHRSTIWLPHL